MPIPSAEARCSAITRAVSSPVFPRHPVLAPRAGRAHMRHLRRCLCGVLALPLAVAGCSKKVEREWSPSDHDRLDESSQQPNARTERFASPSASMSGPTAESEQLWVASCAGCHGATGHGDTTTGRMMRVPDLTEPSWQSTTPNARVAASIVSGRGKMPAFDLPGPIIHALVTKIRSFRQPNPPRQPPAAR